MKHIILPLLLMATACMSVKPFPEIVRGDFKISELDSSKNIIRCSSEHATINRVENKIGSKLYFDYKSSSLNIKIPAARWVGGNAYEGINLMDGKKYVVTMEHHKKPFVLYIEKEDKSFVTVGFKCWGDQSIAMN